MAVPSRAKRVIAIAAGVVVLAAIVAISVRRAGREKGVEVYLEAVERRDIARIVKASGQIDPRVKVNISAHVVGKIERLFVAEGDRIERGQPFLELETEAFVASRDRAAAALEIAQSRLRQADVDLEDRRLKLRRAERLGTEQVLSPEQLETSQLAERSAALLLEQAREAVIEARAELDKAADDLEKATIYAPITGRVIELNAEQGEVVVSGTMNNPASVIGTIADLSELLAEVDVDETEIVYVEPGQRARLDVDAIPDRSYEGHVVEIGSSGFEQTQQPDVTFFKVKILLTAGDPALRPGMSVRAEIDTAEHAGVLVVPIQSVVEREPKREGDATGDQAPVGAGSKAEEVDVVFVGAGGKAEQRQVATGLSDATHVEITSGVAEGETVVTGPYRALRDLDDGDAIEERKVEEDDGKDGEATGGDEREQEAGEGG